MDHKNTFKIGNMDAFPNLKWAEGLEVSLPQQLIDSLLEYYDIHSNKELSFTDHIQSEKLKKAAQSSRDTLRLHCAFTNKKPLSSRLPFSYHFIPQQIRSIIGHYLGSRCRKKIHEWATFPRWPLDLSVDFVDDITNTFQQFSPTPVLLTHDIDSPEGLHNLFQFLDIEEEFEAKSANYVVPCAWAIDHSILENAQSRGHEIGVHGYDHSNKTPFLETSERRKRLLGAQSFIKRYGSVGYRAPSLVRTKALLQDLREFYSYDSSIPTAGGLFPVPNNGCATARPFEIYGLLEIPLTLPRDGSLRFLGYKPQEILDTWITCAEIISRSGGIISLLTHCEKNFSGNTEMLEIYRKFIKYIAENNTKFRFMLPRDLLEL